MCVLKSVSRSEEEGTASYRGSETKRVLIYIISGRVSPARLKAAAERAPYLGPLVICRDAAILCEHLPEPLLPQLGFSSLALAQLF